MDINNIENADQPVLIYKPTTELPVIIGVSSGSNTREIQKRSITLQGFKNN